MENIHGLSTAIATVVRKLRDKAGLTQSAFADFAGLSHVYIAQLETEARGASLTALILIGRAVGL
ncbi:MAG: helix-turn-helix transcriptional regulator, partial [Bilophila sp.]